MDDPQQIAKALGAVLRAARERCEWTREQAVEELAELTGRGVEPRTLLSYEHGARHVPVWRLVDFAQIYGTPAQWMVSEAIRKAHGDPACPTCGRE